MSFVTLLDDGFEVITTRQNVEDFDPLLGSVHDVDVGPFWRLAPDDAQDLPSDEIKFIESMWKGLLQHFSELMVEAAHLDATKSLTAFPMHFERKWLDFQIERQVSLDSEVANLLVLTDDVPLSNLSTYTDANDRPYSLFNLYGTDALARIGISLRSAVGHRTQLRAQVQCGFDWDDRGVPGEVWMLWGYANTQQRAYSKYSTLSVAVSSTGRLGVLTVMSPGTFAAPLTDAYVRFDLAPVTVSFSPGDELTISMWYNGQAQGLENGQRASIMCQVTAKGVTVEWETDLAFEVVGELGVSPAAWWGDAFVAWAPPREIASRVSEFGEGDYLLKLRPRDLTFLDPSVAPEIRYIPVLQPRVTDSRDILRAGLEFELERDPRGRWGYLRFDTEPPATLWAESTALDLRLMHKMFAPLTGVAAELGTSDTYHLRTQIVGALYGLLSGPHLTQLAIAIGGLMGAPMALESGRVKSFTDLSGQPAIVVEEDDRDRIYPYLQGMVPLVAPGDVVSRFDPLVQMPQMHDWITAPSQLADLVGDEVQKYAAFLVQIPHQFLMAEYNLLPRPVTPSDVSAFTTRFSRRLTRYLAQTVGVWCGIANAIMQIIVNLNEDMEIDDTVLFSGRRDHYLATITALPAVPAGTPEYDANPVTVSDEVDLALAILIGNAFIRDGKAGFTFDILEYDKTAWPKDRTVLYAREALTGADDPRYNDHDPSRSYGAGPTPPAPCPPSGLIYNHAEIWVLDTRMNVIVNYNGVDTGPTDVTIYDTTVTMSHTDVHEFEEPDFWDECRRSVGTLDFSDPDNSGHAGGGMP